MNDYVIGSAAVLTAGPSASIAPATIHAQTDPVLAVSVRAGLIDFEANTSGELSQIVAFAAGWNGRQVAENFIAPLVRLQECALTDVMLALAQATQTTELHIFARWLPDDRLAAALATNGVTLIAHPLEAIRRAALISGQSYRRWPSPLRAA